MKHSLFALLLFSTNLYSAADEPHPIIDSNYISKYSYNIENMDLNELKNTQKALKNHLNKANIKKVDSKKNIEKKLLDALLKYDDVRIQITKVIDEIIVEYQVNSEIRNILISFKETFKNIIKDNRPLVKNLRDYKAYDFRLGSAYLAMMSAFHETEESKKFYSKLVKDKKNNTTSIGKYNADLQSAQININIVKKEMEKLSEISDIQTVLANIEKEISGRN
jgi:archaellum component FlaF (FlaF/FlaG flagellin family)